MESFNCNHRWESYYSCTIAKSFLSLIPSGLICSCSRPFFSSGYTNSQAASLSLGYFTIPVLFLGALTFSIITVYLFNRVHVGKFVVGQIGNGRSATPVHVERSTTGEVPA